MERQPNIVSFDDVRRGRSSRARNNERAGERSGVRSGNPRTGDTRAGGSRSGNPRTGGARGEASRGNERAGVRSGNPRTSGSTRNTRHNSGTLFADEDFYNSLNFADASGEVSSRGRSSDSRRSSDRRGGNDPRGDSRDNDPRRSRRSSSRDAERVTEVYEEESFDEDFDPEEIENAKKGPFAKFKGKREKAKRSKAKEKAGKKFADQYGGDSTPSDASAGPRAAVYKGEMGSQHKKATRLQGDGASHNGGGSGSSVKQTSKSDSFNVKGILSSPFFIGLCAILVCILFSALFLYEPAKEWYQEMRERDRLELEFAAIQERNEHLEDSIDYLSTDEGIEDKAREEFGWVKDDEHAMSVSGITVEENSDFAANILSSDIKPPDTWYSDFLDPFFGVDYDAKPETEKEEGSDTAEESNSDADSETDSGSESA